MKKSLSSFRRSCSAVLFLVLCLTSFRGANALTNNNNNNNNQSSTKLKLPSRVMKGGSSILVVGATGSTGLRAIQGLLDVGFRPNQIKLLTRNGNGAKSNALREQGFKIVQGDLEDIDSLEKQKKVIQDCCGCYIHSTSSDIPELDKLEVQRAINLAIVIGGDSNTKIRSIVYNSAAAHENHGVGRIQQKHDVEEVFRKTVTDFNNNSNSNSSQKRQRQQQKRTRMTFTSLRANIFMEELWKRYTRPQILDGTYPLPVPGNRKIYLTSVRDMGRLAGTIMIKDNNNDDASSSAAAGGGGATKTTTTITRTGREQQEQEDETNMIRIIQVAGDYLSANDIANAFAQVQGSSCHHHNPRLMTLKSYFYFPELYEQIRFLQTFNVDTDIEALRERFPDTTITSFENFLRETHWEDTEKTFSDFADTKLLEYVAAR